MNSLSQETHSTAKYHPTRRLISRNLSNDYETAKIKDCEGERVTRKVIGTLIGGLSNNVFERRTSTVSGLFSFFDGGFAQIFSQNASIKVKKLRNTNFISSRHVKRENTSLPVDVRRSKTSLLKLPKIKRRGRQ